MISPLEQYKLSSKNINIKDIAYDTLYNKYIIRNDRGKDKLSELDSTDQESLFLKFNGGYPSPGLIYTFIYRAKKEDEMIICLAQGNEKRYIDFIPIVFCLIPCSNNVFCGLNLNALPNTERLKFLEEYYQVYESFFKNIENSTENNKLTINKSFVDVITNGNTQKFLKNISGKIGSNFNYAYRKYDFKRIDNIRMIEYNEWQFIPFYEPKNAFRMMNQKQIHEFYWKTKT